MRNITLYSLDDYNQGNIISFTIELDDLDYADFQQAIKDNLQSIDKKLGGEKRNRWKVGEYENIPSDFVGEYCLDKSFFDFLKKIKSTPIGETAFEAGILCGIPMEEVESCFQGKFDNDDDFVRFFIEKEEILNKIPQNLQKYFDFNAYKVDLKHRFEEKNGYYFIL